MLLFLLSALSRLPFAGAGFGLDPDNQRVVLAARTLADTGVYRWSRPPGHPVQEYALSLLVSGGPWAINGTTVFLSCACILFFAACLRELAVPDYLLLAAAFACVPVVYINSTCAMDYVWALAFILAAAYSALRSCAWAAGLSLGLAIGIRITSGAMLLPIALIAAAKPQLWSVRWRQWLKMTTATLAVGGFCFLPVFARYGTRSFSYSDVTVIPPGTVLRRATLGVWGGIGCIALAWALVGAALSARGARLRLPSSQMAWLSSACVGAIALYVVAYLELPHEAGYLIPCVPFVICLAALWQTRAPARVFALLLIAAAFVDCRDGQLALPGPVLIDYQQRLADAKTVAEIIGTVDRLPERTVVIAGFHLPAIQVALMHRPQALARYRYLLKNTAHYEQLRRDGFAIFYVDAATAAYQARVTGLRLRRPGARPLLEH